MDRILIFNAKILTPYRLIDNGSILVENGKIVEVSRGRLPVSECIAIDAKGYYVSPGFIDIHTHGGGGYDFMDGTVEAYLGAARKHACYGTTAMVPTTLTSSLENLRETFEVYKQAKAANKMGAVFLGLHLEGPYFSMEQRGAQDPKYIRNPKREEYEKILSWSDDVVRWSAAPELEGALEFGRFLRERNILPSIGHSNAIYEEVIEAFENGYTHVTHLYSGMSGVRRINAYRYAGVIESAFLIDEMTVEIIADGAHLPASLLKLIYKIKGPQNIALITDSMRAAGMPEGEYILGSLKEGQKVIVEEGVAKLPDRTAFAGSVATADRLVRTMVQLAQVPLMEAVQMITATPARIMKVDDRKGSIAVGKDADLVIFDDDINVHLTMVEGRIVYKGEAL
ncbi:N-acetylglucosamine-6-phosphate deacetylase [Caldicoprobacter faecalis]|uniref:N-acetylglucosamine-6-phosphate deacetylase n=1 Tax=Caldicoprobacter faecalis TaxID=937334 RepID=A0A1I5SCN8_9FIRM|nr:N-acetylglucosamine-6-phosphate deacetylase [Caldicoprobacter faecalis]SFP68491.1 N-acetylglucosamine-6-phosphate deacetylase [Caldicoprobacter faecalis]